VQMFIARFVVFISLASIAEVVEAGTPAKWLIVSAPREGKVAYKRIAGGEFLGTETVHTLISTGLVHPQGMAVDQQSGKLLIADPDSKQILAYKLSSRRDSLTATLDAPAMKNVEARWVAVDGLGNVYATDEPSNRILKINASQIASGDANPAVLYDGMALTQVSGPGGIAVDNYNTYWVNKQIGTQVGSLIQGSTAPESANHQSSVKALTTNTDKSYGLCAALNHVFYTQPEASIFAVKKTGNHAVQTVSRKLSLPRGCAWDGDGTVYVADRGANAVFSFAANMPNSGAALLEKAVDFEDAFGVAVFSSGSLRQYFISSAVLIILAVRWQA